MSGEAAFAAAGRLLNAIEVMPLLSSWKLAALSGMARADFSVARDTPEAMPQRAGMLLYHAKLAGRNKTMRFADVYQAALHSCLSQSAGNSSPMGRSMGGARFQTYDPVNCRNGPSLEGDKAEVIIVP